MSWINHIPAFSFFEIKKKFLSAALNYIFLILRDYFVMRVIRQELFKRGFAGKKIKSNEYGKLYVFEDTNK